MVLGRPVQTSDRVQVRSRSGHRPFIMAYTRPVPPCLMYRIGFFRVGRVFGFRLSFFVLDRVLGQKSWVVPSP